MAEEEAAVDVAEAAPAPSPEPAPAVPSGPFDVSTLSTAQVSEIFKTVAIEERLSLLARCLSVDAEEEEDLRKQIWLDMVLKVLIFCYDNELNETKTLAFLGVMASLHAHAVETMCTKVEAFEFYKSALVGATKALPLTNRFSLGEVQALTSHANNSYIDSIKLHQLVFTQEQTIRESEAELFLQTPAVPPPMWTAVDPDALPPVNAPADAPAPADADAAPPAADESAPEGEAEAATEAEAPSNDALTDAISATINSQVAAHQSQLAAEFAAQEQTLLDRIGTLETKLK